MAEESFYFIKMTAKEPSSRTYVLLCIVVPENKSGVDRMDLVVYQNPETVAIGPYLEQFYRVQLKVFPAI
jgi:hypothetical protein